MELQQWLSDCQSEIQNFNLLIEKDSARYAHLCFPHPDEPRPFDVVDSSSITFGDRPLNAADIIDSATSVNKDNTAAAFEIHPVLQIIRKRISYYMQKKHYLSKNFSVISDIIKNSGNESLIPPIPPTENLSSNSFDDVSLHSSITEEQRTFDDINRVLESEMKTWLQEKGISTQPLSLSDYSVRGTNTDSLPSISSSLFEQDGMDTVKRPATSQQQATSPPYMKILSQNNLSEQFCRVDLVRGFTLIRVSRLSVLEPCRLHLRSIDEAMQMLDVDPNPKIETKNSQPSSVADKTSSGFSAKSRRRVSIKNAAKNQGQRLSDASSL